MFDSHIPCIKEVYNTFASRKASALLCLLGCLDVFVRDKVVHHKRNFCLVKDIGKSGFFKLVDGNRRRDIVSKNHVELYTDEVSRRY